jgi:hypothetical protein
MLKLCCCDICKNRIESINEDRCKAYPDGIPQDVMDSFEDAEHKNCAKGFSFEDNMNHPRGQVDPNGLFRKLFDIVGYSEDKST